MVRLWVSPTRLLARRQQVLWRFARGVDGKIPLSPRHSGRKTEIDRIGAGVEHQAECVLLIFMDHTSKPFFFRVSPVGQSSLRGEPMDLGVRVELLLAQNRMRATKGDHAMGKPENLLMLFKIIPVIQLISLSWQ